ncbi:hypothetical protein [Tateyamaria sp.]|uniref:hypothetical protein n=1 Tax=Tateyamaria sp. TaxID=1929288 RepID=UPI00329C366B
MNFKATKTPLLIAAMAAAVTLTSIVPANASTAWISTGAENAQVVDGDFEVINANFKFKKHKSFKYKKFHHSKKFHGHSKFKKKKHVSKHSLVKKKLYKKLF